MKVLNKVTAIILVLIFSVTALPLFANANTEKNSFAGGAGTSDSPFLVETKQQLNDIRNYPSAYFKQIADIEFDAEDFQVGGDFYNNGRYWTPIGTDSKPFSGSYDGNGYSVLNLKIYLSGKAGIISDGSSGGGDWTGDYIIGGSSSLTITPAVGLFGFNTGEIKSLAVAGSSVYARATNLNSIYVGGIVGYNKGTVSKCYTYISVTATSSSGNYAGGVVGYNSGGTVSDCFATNSTSGYYAGGVVGGGNKGSVTTCYNVGNVTGKKYTGGIIGYTDGMVVENCYYTDNITHNVGQDTDFGVALNEFELKTESAFKGFDFEKVWTMAGDKKYVYPEIQGSDMDLKKEYLKIAVTTEPTKTSYLESKDDLDLTGGKLTVYYDNETEKEIPLSEAVVSGFDNSVVGEQILTVTYKNMITTFAVEIVTKSLVSVEVYAKPNKTEYLEAVDNFDVTGGKLKLYNNNDTDTIVDMKSGMVTGFDINRSGKQTITVTYANKTTTFDVNVLPVSAAEITELPQKTVYIQNEENIDAKGAKATLYYENGENRTIDILSERLSGFDNKVLGKQKISVNFSKVSAEFRVDIVGKFMPGDINDDGEIDTKDVVDLCKIAADWQDVEYNQWAVDTNGDGKFNLSDAVFLARYLAKWEGTVLSDKHYIDYSK